MKLSTPCRLVLPLIPALAMLGCAGWSADPDRVSRDYGHAVKSLAMASILDPAKAKNPAPLAPDGMDGQKAGLVYQRAYQADVGQPARVRATPQLNITNRNGGSSGGASQ